MDLTRILLIGILYLAQLVVAEKILNKQILSDGKPISCGSRWKNTGVKYQIYYGPEEQVKGDETAEVPEAIEVPGETEVPEVLEDEEDDKGEDTSIVSSAESDISSTAPGALDYGEIQNVYEYCMDENTKRVFYTKYEIENPVEMIPATASGKRGPYEKQISYIRSSPKQSQVKNNYDKILDYDSQLVVIPDFTPRFELIDGFYEYDISAPLNTELTQLWKKVIDEIKAKIHKINEPIHVYSGTYDTYRLHGVIYYINIPENLLPAPFAWWILLYNQNETKGISVIMQNFAFSNGEKKKLLCGESICSEVGLKVPEYSHALIYCCPAQTILDEYEFTKEPINGRFDFR